MDKKLKIIYAVTIGAIGAIIFITIVTIAADLYLPLKGWLKNVFSHHWVAKSVLATIIFLVGGFSVWLMPLKTTEEEKIIKALKYLIWLTIFGTLAIFGFFIYETF